MPASSGNTPFVVYSAWVRPSEPTTGIPAWEASWNSRPDWSSVTSGPTTALTFSEMSFRMHVSSRFALSSVSHTSSLSG